jgi:hypothetical protein
MLLGNIPVNDVTIGYVAFYSGLGERHEVVW